MTLRSWGATAFVAAALTVGCNTRDTNRYDESTTTVTGSQSPAGTAGEAARGADAELFAKQAMTANKAEVKLGELAGKRGQSLQVKEFAQMMVRDHTSALQSLKDAVKPFNVDEPSELDAKHQALYDRLSTLNGAEFDREYMKAMVEGHGEVRAMLEQRAGTAPTTTGTSGADNSQLDAAVNQWSTKTLPAVNQHLQKAEQISGQLK